MGLSPITRELVHIRASQINGCGVCSVQHPRIARKLGETDERIWAIAGWRDAPYFDDAERAALALAEAVTRLADRAEGVPDEVWDEAVRHYDERQLGALVLTIAAVNLWNRLNVTTRRSPARSGDQAPGWGAHDVARSPNTSTSAGVMKAWIATTSPSAVSSTRIPCGVSCPSAPRSCIASAAWPLALVAVSCT